MWIINFILLSLSADEKELSSRTKNVTALLLLLLLQRSKSNQIFNREIVEDIFVVYFCNQRIHRKILIPGVSRDAMSCNINKREENLIWFYERNWMETLSLQWVLIFSLFFSDCMEYFCDQLAFQWIFPICKVLCSINRWQFFFLAKSKARSNRNLQN